MTPELRTALRDIRRRPVRSALSVAGILLVTAEAYAVLVLFAAP